MKTSVTLVVTAFLAVGIIAIFASRFLQIPFTQAGPFTERHDVNLGYASPSAYVIRPGQISILTYNLTEGTLVRVTMTISGGSGNDIRFNIRDSEGNIVLNPGIVSNTYSYDFAAPKTDSFRVYMDNSFSIISTKNVIYRVIEAYYTDLSYEPRTTLVLLGKQYPWLEWIGIGAILFPVSIFSFLGVKYLDNRWRIAAQARVEEEQLAAEREQQRRREEEEQRRMAFKQDAENFMKAGRYEEAASFYEQLQMWDEAGECRRLARTSYVVDANVRVDKEGISVSCPHCGSSERLESKVSEVTCKHCGRKYFIPRKILNMI